MPCDTHGPFPTGVVRDLLGVTRALYRASASDPVRRDQLEQVGKRLRLALDLAEKSGPGTLGRRAAWSHAEQSAATLGSLVADGCTVAPLVRAAAAKLTRG